MKYEEAAKEPAKPARNGYKFAGWDKVFDKITGDTTVTAKYEKNEYKVTFKDWDGKVLSEQNVKYEEAAKEPAKPARNGYKFAGWDKAFNKIPGNLVVTAQYKKNAVPTPKATIQGTATYLKAFGSKAFRLNLKATGKVSYHSSNSKVASVSSDGMVTLKGTGIAVITETAVSGSSRAAKKVMIKVVPKKENLKVKVGKKKLSVSWKKDRNASGYQIQIAGDKKFKKAKTYTVGSWKTYKKTIKRLKARRRYNVRVRAYKKVGKTKLYGSYSAAKKVKVK